MTLTYPNNSDTESEGVPDRALVVWLMTYAEFVERRKQGAVVAGIDRSTAFKLVDYLPKRYQATVTFWSWVWMLSVPFFILVSVFVNWWVGLLMLVFVTPTISRATKNSAIGFVL